MMNEINKYSFNCICSEKNNLTDDSCIVCSNCTIASHAICYKFIKKSNEIPTENFLCAHCTLLTLYPYSTIIEMLIKPHLLPVKSNFEIYEKFSFHSNYFTDLRKEELSIEFFILRCPLNLK